jgi:hypothetical protein
VRRAERAVLQGDDSDGRPCVLQLDGQDLDPWTLGKSKDAARPGIRASPTHVRCHRPRKRADDPAFAGEDWMPRFGGHDHLVLPLYLSKDFHTCTSRVQRGHVKPPCTYAWPLALPARDRLRRQRVLGASDELGVLPYLIPRSGRTPSSLLTRPASRGRASSHDLAILPCRS